jgi:hypothetical protein
MWDAEGRLGGRRPSLPRRSAGLARLRQEHGRSRRRCGPGRGRDCRGDRGEINFFASAGRQSAASPAAANTASSGAESAIAGCNLARRLASEQQMGEGGTPLAGAGTATKLRAAERLAGDYGGVAEDWPKMGSSSYRGADWFQFETHWYENLRLDGRFEPETKFQWVP